MSESDLSLCENGFHDDVCQDCGIEAADRDDPMLATSAAHNFGEGYAEGSREARAALLDELEAAVRGMDATCHDGEGLRCEHVEDWPGVPGAPFDDGCNTDVSRASVQALIQQHREENP